MHKLKLWKSIIQLPCLVKSTICSAGTSCAGQLITLSGPEHRKRQTHTPEAMQVNSMTCLAHSTVCGVGTPVAVQVNVHVKFRAQLEVQARL